MTKKKEKDKEAAFLADHVAFSIVQLPVDQNSPITTQRVLQFVTREGETKVYATESSYFKGEMYSKLSDFIEESMEVSIMKQQTTLAPVRGGRYWVPFNEDTLSGKPQKRVDPEKFE